MSTTSHQSGIIARRSVWLLAIGGSAIGAVLFLSIALVLSNSRAERLRQDREHRVSDAALRRATGRVIEARDRIVGTLIGQQEGGSLDDEQLVGLRDSFDLLGRYFRDEGFAKHATSVDNIAADVFGIADQTQSWRQAIDRLRTQQRATRRTIAATLNELQGRFSQLEGKTRLEVAKAIRQARREGSASTLLESKQALSRFTERSELSSINTELATLGAILERIAGESRVDNLADAQDNQLKPLVERLTPHCERFEVADQWSALLVAAFGDGYRIDPSHQTIHLGTGGLLGQAKEIILLDSERQRLFADVSHSYDAWRQQLAELRLETEEATAESVRRLEAALSWTWYGAALFGLVANGLFFLLAFRISRTIDNQIDQIDRVGRELAQAQKLESIGQLAAGIAHEINTPMQYLMGNVDYLTTCSERLFAVFDTYEDLLEANSEAIPWQQRVSMARDIKEREKFDVVRREVPAAIKESCHGLKQVLEIVRAMKSFSHPGSSDFTLTELPQAIVDAATITRNRWKYHADLVTDLPDDLPAIEALPAELNQVFLNLIINAADAIAEVFDEGGEKGLIAIGAARDGDRVTITIRDTGVGIPEEIREKIFEPFFTTKDVGKGTGQGLTFCYNIVVHKHRGDLDVLSTPGEGTTFRISLPLRRPKPGGEQEPHDDATGDLQQSESGVAVV